MDPLLLLVLVVVLVISLTSGIKIVPAQQAFMLERLGKYERTLTPGLHVIIPVVDRIAAKLPTDEKTLLAQREPLITRDCFVALTDIAVHYQVTDPQAAIYQVNDYVHALHELTVKSLRELMSGMDLEAALMSQAVLAVELRRRLSWTTGSWGLRINRVEVTHMEHLDQA